MPEEVAVALLSVNASVSPHKCFTAAFLFVCLFLKLNQGVSWNVYLACLLVKQVSRLQPLSS